MTSHHNLLPLALSDHFGELPTPEPAAEVPTVNSMHSEAAQAAKSTPIALPLVPIPLAQRAAQQARTALHEWLRQPIIVAARDARGHGEVPWHLGAEPARYGGWLRVERVAAAHGLSHLLPLHPPLSECCFDAELGALQHQVQSTACLPRGLYCF